VALATITDVPVLQASEGGGAHSTHSRDSRDNAYVTQPVLSLSESDLAETPFRQFDKWFSEAIEAELPQPEAMTLAAASSSGSPSARIVLLKSFDDRGFVFFTNYESRKSRELSSNPRVALVFFWSALERQVRIEGTIERIPESESDLYFATRPRGSQLGAWVSEQSSVIPARAVLEQRLEQLIREHDGADIPRPPFWGGWRVVPSSIEFWQGRADRLHDRLVYRRDDQRWRIERLSP